MTDSPVSRAEFENFRKDIRDNHQDLKADIATGFESVKDRLDEMNGTQRDHGVRISVLESKHGKVSMAAIFAVLSLIVAGATAFAAFR